LLIKPYSFPEVDGIRIHDFHHSVLVCILFLVNYLLKWSVPYDTEPAMNFIFVLLFMSCLAVC